MPILVGNVCRLIVNLHRGPVTFPKGILLVYEGLFPDDHPSSSTGFEHRFRVKKDGRNIHMSVTEIEKNVQQGWGRYLVDSNTFDKLLGSLLL